MTLPLYQNNAVFRALLNTIFERLNLVPAGAATIPVDILFPAQLHMWGARDFNIDHQNTQYVGDLNGLRAYLDSQGLLTQFGIIVSKHSTPDRSHPRGGGGDDDGPAGGGGVENGGGAAAVAP